MVRATEEIAKDIAEFQPSNGNWLLLDELVNELWISGQPSKAISHLLKVFERFPEEDGAGVFWAILHGLESIEGYEAFLLNSVCSAPSKFGVILLGRLLNSGVKEIEGKSIAQVLKEIKGSPSIQRQATRFFWSTPQNDRKAAQQCGQADLPNTRLGLPVAPRAAVRLPPPLGVMNRTRLLLVAVLLIGCSPFGKREARIEHFTPVGATLPTHRVFLQAPTGQWGCSPHSLGYNKEIAWFSIRLPDTPAPQARFDATQVVLFNESASPHAPITVTSGYVLLDQPRREIQVSFQTPNGPFWANGVYPASWQ